MTTRYAIYYAPRADSRLWTKACAWLGRDAVTGEDLAQPDLPGLEGVNLARLTADPRGYGFHATLKAPFELAAGRRETELVQAAVDLAARLTPFEATIAPDALGRFLAFQLQSGEGEMAALHEACLKTFEPFRAPLSEADLVRRRQAGLTPEQDARLVAWGYPYVFDQFRFHMTLTGSIPDKALRARALAALQDHFAEETGPHLFDGVAIFRQLDRQAPFRVVARLAFPARAEA